MATVGAAPAFCTGVAPAAAEASPSCCPASAAAFDAADLCRCCLCILLTDATMLHATAYSHCSRQLAHGGIAADARGDGGGVSACVFMHNESYLVR